MMKRQILVIAAVVLVVICAAAIVLWPSGGGGKEGWYAWDPTVGEIDSSKISATPKIIDVIEDMYHVAYGDLPQRKTAPDMAFPSLVEPAANGSGIVIKGSLKTSAGPVVDVPVYLTHEEIENMKIISYGLGFTDSYAKMFDDRDDSVWDTVVAAGNSTWSNYDHQMEGTSLGSEMTISFDALNAFLTAREGSADETFCLVVWGYIVNYDALNSALSEAGYTNVKILCVDYYAITSPESFVSVIDALGQLAGIQTKDNGAITDFQDRLFTMTDAISASDAALTVYMELDALGKSPGTGTLAQLCFDILGLENINETPGIDIFSREVVVTSTPDVIFFDVRDTRTMNQKMRVVT
jgi:hypothetical protein